MHKENYLKKTKTLWVFFQTFKDENKMNIMWEKIRQNVYIIKSEGETTKPMMVFSVIGDSGSFVPTPWPANVFQTALIEAAKSGGGRV